MKSTAIDFITSTVTSHEVDCFYRPLDHHHQHQKEYKSAALCIRNLLSPDPGSGDLDGKNNGVDDSHKKMKRKRASPSQLLVLNRVFNQTSFPSTELRAQLGEQLSMSPRTVQIWFQNKRQALRTQGRSRSKRNNGHRGTTRRQQQVLRSPPLSPFPPQSHATAARKPITTVTATASALSDANAIKNCLPPILFPTNSNNNKNLINVTSVSRHHTYMTPLCLPSPSFMD